MATTETPRRDTRPRLGCKPPTRCPKNAATDGWGVYAWRVSPQGSALSTAQPNGGGVAARPPGARSRR